MTREEQKDLTTELLDGRELSDELFDTLLEAAKVMVEGERPWRFLVAEDSAVTIGSSNVYTTLNALPARWRQMDGRKPIVLVAGTTVKQLEETPFNQRHANQNRSGVFYIDYSQQKFGVCGTLDQTYTAYIYYIQYSPAIAENADWIFPDAYHAILPHMVAVIEKGGINYDEINARQVIAHSKEASVIFSAMVKWDADLARRALGF